MKKAIFLDRDGTIIEEVNFLSTVEETRLFPYTVEALQMLRDAGFLFFVTTNQSGIARGYFGPDAVNAIHKKIQAELQVGGVRIESFHFCPHFPDEGCVCRKPGIGMIKDAIEDLEVDLANSWMIGDKKLDVDLGHNAGTRTALVSTGYGAQHKALLEQNADVFADNILEAAKEILKFESED